MHFWSYLNIAPQVVLAAAVVVFLLRRLQVAFPFFFGLMLLQLAYFVAAGLAYTYALSDPVRLSFVYQWVFVSGIGITAILQFGVLYELCDHLLLSKLHFWNDLHILFSWITAFLLLAASVISALLARVEHARLIAVFQTLDFSANLIKIGLLLALLLFTRVLGISWRSLPTGIALGFGISATAEMVASALISQPGRHSYVTIDTIRMVAFHVCVLVWLLYILLPQKKKDSGETGLQMSDFENHMQELQRMVRR